MKKNITIPLPIVLLHFIFMLLITVFVIVPKIALAQSVTDLLVHFDQSGGDSWINTGKVGIGTTNPTETIEVNGNYKFTKNSSTELRTDRIISTADVVSTPSSWMQADNLVLQAGSVTENENSNGTAGNVFIKAGQRNVGGTSGTDENKYGIIGFYTGTTTLAESMRINWNGNVAIGTTDPGSHKLYTNGTGFFKNPASGSYINLHGRGDSVLDITQSAIENKRTLSLHNANPNSSLIQAWGHNGTNYSLKFSVASSGEVCLGNC